MTLRIVAGREDGLCMRLLAVLHAKRLAAGFGAEFGFLWPEADFPPEDQHTVADPGLIFSAPCLAAHLLPATDRPADAPVLAFAKTRIEDVIADARTTGMLIVERPLPVPLPNDAALPSNAELFAQIDWTGPVWAAMAAADALPIGPDATAIHIRGGDILHGTTSNIGTYAHKGVSVFEVEALVARLTAAGKSIWLIGQEPDLIAHLLATHPGVHSLEEAREALGLSAVQAVFFDVIAMSRMAEVYSGRSGVAHLACQLGGATFVDTKVLDLALRPKDYLGDPLAEPRYDGVSHNLKAHSYYKLFNQSAPDAWTRTDLALARLMLRWRPQSQFAKLILCVLCARFDLWDEAETLALNVIGPETHEGWADVIVDHVMSPYDTFPSGQVAVLARAEADQYPACALIGACGPKANKALILDRISQGGLAVSPALLAFLSHEEGRSG